MSNKGIVVKINDFYCIILTGDGTYHKVSRSRVSNPRVGAESEFFPVNWVNRLKPLLMVACLLVAVLSFNFYRMAASADPVAYVALDINPSLELGVDKNSRVVTVSTLNQDAENLIKGLNIKGDDLYLAVRQILDEAEASGYMKTEETNYILSTVTPVETSANAVDYNKIADNLENAVETKDLDVNFVILSADETTRQEARNKGVSTGKLLVYKNSIDSGEKLSLEQVKQTSVTSLVRNHKVLELPGNKKGFVKSIRVPRKNGQQKKSISLPQDDASAVKPDSASPFAETNNQDKPVDAKDALKPKPVKPKDAVKPKPEKAKDTAKTKPDKAKDAVKLKPNKKDRTEPGESFFDKLRRFLHFDRQDNPGTSEAMRNKDSVSEVKQSGKIKKGRSADPVKEIEKKSLNKISDKISENEEIRDPKAGSSEKKSSEKKSQDF